MASLGSNTMTLQFSVIADEGLLIGKTRNVALQCKGTVNRQGIVDKD